MTARLAGVVALSLLGVTGVYAGFVLAGDTGGLAAALFGAALLASGELAYWALEPAAVDDEPRARARRLAVVATVAAAGAAAAVVVLSATAVRAGGGLRLEALGVAAAAGAVAVVAWLAWRRA